MNGNERKNETFFWKERLPNPVLKYQSIKISICQAVLWSRSRSEPDFFAGAGAGKKASAPVLLLNIFVENLNF